MTDETPPLTSEDKDNIRKEFKDLLAWPEFNSLDPEADAFWRNYHSENDLEIPQSQRDVAIHAFNDTLKSLMETNPELSLGLGRMAVVVSNRTGTISTDNEEIYINPRWWATRSPRELRHCAAFAALSIIYDSINRGKAIPDVDYHRWELACNLVINRTLIDEGIGVMPAEGAFITSIHSQMTSEEVYSRLTGMTDAEINRAVWPFLSFDPLD